jgi:hypothetical protein
MELLQVWSLLQRNDINQEDAAEALGITPKDLKFRLTKWGHKLPLLLATLDKIKVDAITRDEAAAVLEVTVRQINNLMNSWKVERPIKNYLIEREASQVKWELRKKYAIDYIGGSLDLEKAATAAAVSDRQMRRWVSELLIKHFDMPFKDLRQVSEHRRRRLAGEIEHAEGLEKDKLRLVETISDGQKSLKDEAIERVLSKNRRKRHV